MLELKVLELSRWQVDRKHVVELLKSAALGLRETQEAEQGAQAANACEEKPNLAAEVSLILVDEERNPNGQGDSTDLVEGRGQADVEASQPGRGHLGHEDEAIGADGDVVDEVARNDECALPPRRRGRASRGTRDEVQDTDPALQEREDDAAPEVCVAAAEKLQEPPRGARADKPDGVDADVHGEGVVGAEPRKLEEVDGKVVEHHRADEGLHRVGHKADNKPSQVRAAEALAHVWLGAFLGLVLGAERLADEAQLEGRVDVGGREAAEGVLGRLVLAALAQPVGRVRAEGAQGEEEHEHGEGPLAGDGELVGPLRGDVVGDLEDARAHELARDEEHVDGRGGEAAQHHGAHLAHVGGGADGEEGDDAAVEQDAGDELCRVAGEELDEDEGDGQG